jgi:hypothetical protein
MSGADDAMMDRLARAQALAVQGHREEARALYAALYAEALGSGDPYWACVAAHFLAHMQGTAEAQRDWHLRALAAADAVGDERILAFYPSLHANLAEVYLRLNDPAQACAHLAQARAAERLPPGTGDPSVALLIERVTQALDGAGAKSPVGIALRCRRRCSIKIGTPRTGATPD